jgi:hypothetical protein
MASTMPRFCPEVFMMAPMLLDLGATCTQADLRQTLGIPR